MNTGHEHAGHEHDCASGDCTSDDRAFDARLRQVHAQAVAQVPARTLAQLHPHRAPVRASTPSRWTAWPLAATCAIALVAGGMLIRYPTQPIPQDPTAMEQAASVNGDSEPGDVYAALDESPELYLWLGSNDTDTLITE